MLAQVLDLMQFYEPFKCRCRMLYVERRKNDPHREKEKEKEEGRDDPLLHTLRFIMQGPHPAALSIQAFLFITPFVFLKVNAGLYRKYMHRLVILDRCINEPERAKLLQDSLTFRVIIDVQKRIL